MAISFIVEDGTGVTGATSYVSLADAADIMSVERSNTAMWTALTDDDKQFWLMWATRWLEDRIIWRGKRVSDPCWPQHHSALPAQALAWPRRDVKDRTGMYISRMVVPDEVKRACVLVGNHYLNVGDEEFMQSGLRMFRTGTFELEWQTGFIQNSTPDWLKYTLMGLGQIASENGFKKIVRVG